MDLLTNIDTGPLVANKITRNIYEELSAQGQLQERELYFITSADSVVVDIDKIDSGGTDYGPEISELSADKRDYDDLTYNDKTVRAPTYGIGKMTATPSDGQTDPIVMDTFFIHENEGGTSLGSCWYKATALFCGTTDGTNFTLVNISFQTLATFTKTQLLAGEVTFTYDNKEWTLTAELGDGMVDKFDITINKMKWTTSHYDYDPQTNTSKWWINENSFFLTRSWTSSGSLSNYWRASLYRGDDGVHGNVLVASFNIGGTMGYRAGGYVPSFTYGERTQPVEWQVAGYPCQGTFGFSECVPTRNSQLVNDSYFVRQSDISAFVTSAWVMNYVND